ncbi:hypothetical protein FSP39_001528 [Pinctada imbricata]|uniref:Uncharacterized protein n=1 Tax=Pinctada imbricata TaxID=66713 RepID=A0AA89BIJ8_PINIB|nr:hypothetical protein FSP39_001528 [Pinctada imbricata]
MTLSEYNNDGFKVALHNKVGKKGSSNGCLQNATGVVHMYSGTVLVSDMILSRITLFAENGRFRNQFSTGQSNEPWDCDIMKNGTIICTLGQDHCIALYSVEGYLKRKIGCDILAQPRGISKFNENSVIVTDTSLNDVLMFDFNGNLMMSFSDENINLKFNQPRYVTTNDKGMILVSDSGNHCIHIFTKEGKLLTTFGGYGRENGDLRFPYGIVCDKEENIYVADHYNNRVSMFTSSGTFLRHVITPEMRLKRPQSLSMCNLMTHNILYVTHGDLKAHEVAVYRIIPETNQYSVSVNAFI